jgi:hypothetical protein
MDVTPKSKAVAVGLLLREQQPLRHPPPLRPRPSPSSCPLEDAMTTTTTVTRDARRR